MSERASYECPAGSNSAAEGTGRYVVTFAEDRVAEGLAALRKGAGVSKLPSAADFTESAIDAVQVATAGGAIFPKLGVAVVSLDEEACQSAASMLGEDSGVLDIEPERRFYALGTSTSQPDYLRGYQDGVSDLIARLSRESSGDVVEAAASFLDDGHSTWGLKATNVINSRWTGRGIKVAVLDTGLDLTHPDFRGRSIVSRSFVANQSVQDGNGHGTHCAGTACGSRDMNERRYGVASDSMIYVGKVLDNNGDGFTSGILAGMEWAINSGCHVISMSLGNLFTSPSTAYTYIGQRALANGSLIVAAAGNHREKVSNPPGLVGQPANSPFILAVGSVTNQLLLSSFSCRSGLFQGSNVDIAGPGSEVYSAFPMSQRYGILSGTSMATPHVAGIAALYAQAFRATGAQLWQLITSRARRLQIDSRDVGAGLVQAPL